MPNPVRIQVLQLQPIMLQQPLEEQEGGRREAPFVKIHKRDDVPRRRRRTLLALGNHPFLRAHQGAQQPPRHQAVLGGLGDVGRSPEGHGEEGEGARRR